MFCFISISCKGSSRYYAQQLIIKHNTALQDKPAKTPFQDAKFNICGKHSKLDMFPFSALLTRASLCRQDAFFFTNKIAELQDNQRK